VARLFLQEDRLDLLLEVREVERRRSSQRRGAPFAAWRALLRRVNACHNEKDECGYECFHCDCPVLVWARASRIRPESAILWFTSALLESEGQQDVPWPPEMITVPGV
jgi:hypothetical protein